MRIGLDALAVQSPQHARRGIGRYARNLMAALRAAPGGHQFVLYAFPDLPADLLPPMPADAVRWVAVDPGRGEPTLAPRMDRLARENPDGLDALLVPSPFEWWASYAPPSRPVRGPVLAAVVHDLIPLLLQDQYLTDPSRAAWFRRRLEVLRRYDLLLANSEATRSDCLEKLGLPPDRVVTIGAAGDGAWFVPDRSRPMPLATASTLRALGIVRPFVLYVGGVDPRKNLGGMIAAFARLPGSLREAHQLVVTFEILPEDEAEVRRNAREQGIGDALVVTGEVPDDALRALYQRCEAFVMPSFYEGFGLPILEAMHCGAPVVTANNSSQSEVAGDAALLVNAGDPGDIAAKLARVLAQPDLADDLRRRGIARASGFSWDRTARKALEALAGAVDRLAAPGRFVAAPRKRPPRPRIAFLSPLPPQKSGVADYALNLVRELDRTYAIDLYHDEGYVPDPCWADAGWAPADVRLFERYLPRRDYRAIVYQMGNSRYHQFLYHHLLRYPGVTTLHDFCLAGFHLHYGRALGRQRDHFASELDLGGTPHADELLGLIDDPEAASIACARRGAYLNRGVFERSRRVVVHSPWCVRQLAAKHPDLVDRAAVIPLGARARVLDDDARRAIRDRFDLPAGATVLAAFGFVHPDKMNPEALRAFQVLSRTDPAALLLFVGQEVDGGAVRREAEATGLVREGRVRFLGRQSPADFADLAAVADIGLNLRRPPTNGETSAALLDLLRHGVATIVTDVATFADFPDAVVRKVRWEAEGLDGLTRTVLDLAGNRARRASLGHSAAEHVRRYHDWSRVADLYVDVIERCHAERATVARGA